MTEWSAFATWWARAGHREPPPSVRARWDEGVSARGGKEVALELSRVESAAVAWLGSDEAYRWLVTPLDAFGGSAPAEMALSDPDRVIGAINAERMVPYSPFLEDPEMTPADYLEAVREAAVDLFEDEAEPWMQCPQSALDGKTPAEMAVDQEGYLRVAEYLEKIAWGEAVGEFETREEINKARTGPNPDRPEPSP